MTCRRMTPEEIEAANAWSRQWWLRFATLGLLAPKPELDDPELEIA